MTLSAFGGTTKTTTTFDFSSEMTTTFIDKITAPMMMMMVPSVLSTSSITASPNNVEANDKETKTTNNNNNNNEKSSSSSSSSPPGSPTSRIKQRHLNVIGPNNIVHGTVSCPCCNRHRKDDMRQTLDDWQYRSESSHQVREPMSDDNDADDSLSSDMDESGSSFLPGVLSDGVQYHVNRILVEGWMHKKGTGMDWMGSKAWKPRWASLVLASMDGYDVDVPLLLIYWFSTSPTPSTVIMLDSTVIIPEDKPEGDWDCYRFQIRHVRKSSDGGSQPDTVTREFSCSQKGRDAWVYAINDTLLDFEKRKARARKSFMTAPLSPISADRSKVWTGDYFPKDRQRSNIPLSPPTSPRSASPRSPHRRPLPRPEAETLLGEALLG